MATICRPYGQMLFAGALVVVNVALDVGAATQFDLGQRKERLAWIWEAPVDSPAPKVKDEGWAVDLIDRFILAKLEENQLNPAADADRFTWLRRVHYAITGLPPAPDVVRGFDGSPDARQRIVKELLSSPHYGERWARHWMDLVRYAESRGHESDYIIANAYHYRDYLIRAFNDDVPYDRFVLEHIAGDVLPSPRVDPVSGANQSVLATGWAFLGEEVHSPVDIRQDECDRIDNKVDVFSRTFMGLTVACARCHDHKFDAISAKDYYAMSGFFLSSSYRQVRFESMEHNRRVAEELELLRETKEKEVRSQLARRYLPALDSVAEYLLGAREVLRVGATVDKKTGTEVPATLGTLPSDRLAGWVRVLKVAAKDTQSPLHRFATVAVQAKTDVFTDEQRSAVKTMVAAKLPGDARVIVDYSNPKHQPWLVDGPAFGSRALQAGDLILGSEGKKPVERIMTYAAARRDPFWNGLKTTPDNENDSGNLAATSRSGQMVRTPTFTIQSGLVHYLIRGETKVYAAVDSHLMLTGPLHGGLIAGFNSGNSDKPVWVTHGLSEYVGHRTHIEFGPDGDASFELLMVIESAKKPEGFPGGATEAIDADSVTEMAQQIEGRLRKACEAFGRGAEESDGNRWAAWMGWMLANDEVLVDGEPDSVAEVMQAYMSEQKALAGKVRWASRTAVSWLDGSGVDESVLARGKHTSPGDPAPRGLPVAFPGAKPVETPWSSGRYKLGESLTAPENPLVARVMVNRVWHHLFGRGIVSTVDNFGFLGERPTHPELLDHLAHRFVHEHKWSLKKLIGDLVLSRAYGMSSKSSDAREDEIDPDNKLMHRMSVRRLEGESIRDALLAVSGRLDRTVGGNPVPVHLTEFVVGRGRPAKSGPLDGEGRRSIYTSVRRNFLPTMMLTFDTPTPFSTVGRRNVTNVPAQSLALMNDKLFHQQSWVWAERLLKEMEESDAGERIKEMFITAYGRPARPEEIVTCEAALKELASFHDGGKDEAGLWTDLCHVIFNANDFIYLR